MRYELKHGITQSLLSLWASCRVAAQYRCDCWRADKPKRATQLGSLVHLFMERYYSRKTGTADNVLSWVKREWRALALKAGDDMKEVERDLAILAALAENYCSFHDKSDAKKKWISLEKLFDVRWMGFRLRGKVDGVYQIINAKADRKENWIMEHKTKSYIRQDELNEALSFNFQNLFYIVALQEALGISIHGVLYNVIRTPQYKEENPKLLCDRIREESKKDPKDWFMRYPVSYPEKQVVAFKSALLDKCKLFADWVKGNAPTYANESACCARWTCDYLQACAARGKMVGYRQEERFGFSELEEA